MDTILSPRRRTVLQALGAATLLAACGERTPGGLALRPQFEFTGPTMGTSFTVKIAGGPIPAAAGAAALDAVDEALAAVVRAMSTYDTDSELSRFNRHAATTPFALSPGTMAVLALAREVSAASNGAFDITVAPVVDAWGFGPDKTPRVLTGAEIGVLEPRVGWRMLALDTRAGTAAKARPDVRADLSGIAKGFAVDQAARALDALGVNDYMIEAGGEVRTRGHNAEDRPWQIAIERPDATPQRPHVIVPLAGLSMATSGDYRIFFERDGRRYCHEIDPAHRPADRQRPRVGERRRGGLRLRRRDGHRADRAGPGQGLRARDCAERRGAFHRARNGRPSRRPVDAGVRRTGRDQGERLRPSGWPTRCPLSSP